jgi:hypothetical protein
MKTLPSVCIGFLVALGTQLAAGQVIYNSASTAGEGYQRGAASVISAAGEASVNASQARINNQDAYSAALDNSTKSVNTFWEQKEIYAQHEQEKLAKITAKRNLYLSKHGLKSLTPEQFDRTTGQVNWPKVLEQKQYDQYRNTLTELFQKRAYNGALTGDEYMQATAASKAWRDLLSSQKDVYPRPILSQMIRFILGLNREMDDNLS